jgi:hypothetical protein
MARIGPQRHRKKINDVLIYGYSDVDICTVSPAEKFIYALS